MGLFGPSKQEIWRQLSAEIGAKYVEGGLMKHEKVQATHGEWTVTLDTFVVTTGKTAIPFTRMRAPFVNPDGFRFAIYRKHFFSGIAKLLGLQDIEIGDEAFDEKFIIKSNDESRIRRLLTDPRLRALIDAQPRVDFSVKDDEGWFGIEFPEDVDELRFSVAGIIKDIDQLKKLYDLFGETLDALCRMGLATDRDPHVAL